jgi:hypothetical protein
MSVQPAKGKKGHLLYSPFTKTHFFRIYDGEGGFTDYDICADDIEIEILDRFLELYEGDRNKLDYSRRTLGKE